MPTVKTETMTEKRKPFIVSSLKQSYHLFALGSPAIAMIGQQSGYHDGDAD
jgi:hypothetical protein